MSNHLPRKLKKAYKHIIMMYGCCECVSFPISHIRNTRWKREAVCYITKKQIEFGKEIAKFLFG